MLIPWKGSYDQPRQHIEKQRYYFANKGPSSQGYGFSICMDVRVGLWRRLSAKELMLLNFGVGEDYWESFELQGDQTSQSWRKSILNIYWKDWCWSWNSNNVATWCEELTHWKRPWCWERLKAGGEGEDRGWDGWMASLTQWTWVWVNSGDGERQGSLLCCSPWGSQRAGHDWATGQGNLNVSWVKRDAALNS